MHVLLLLDAKSGEVGTVCRSAIGVATALIRERGKIGTSDGRNMTIVDLSEAITTGEVEIAFPDGTATMPVRRLWLDQ